MDKCPQARHRKVLHTATHWWVASPMHWWTSPLLDTHTHTFIHTNAWIGCLPGTGLLQAPPPTPPTPTPQTGLQQLTERNQQSSSTVDPRGAFFLRENFFTLDSNCNCYFSRKPLTPLGPHSFSLMSWIVPLESVCVHGCVCVFVFMYFVCELQTATRQECVPWGTIAERKEGKSDPILSYLLQLFCLGGPHTHE